MRAWHNTWILFYVGAEFREPILIWNSGVRNSGACSFLSEKTDSISLQGRLTMLVCYAFLNTAIVYYFVSQKEKKSQESADENKEDKSAN